MESRALAGLCAAQEGRKECLREISLTQKVTPEEQKQNMKPARQ